ncbi:ATP-dependent helicase, partial [Candidatus Uhrbacteria bacterium]|nr:ATP-dependent helicase [Candidatus Uhrbacteria bacterium]
KIDYQKDLNAEQLAVVREGDGPCLVLAGAGSGKTRTIIYRVAYLIERGVSPENILLLTFTNKAAGEMSRRLAGLVGPAASGLWSGTFHSVANRLLRHYAPLVGLTPSFSILDQEDSRTLIRACLKEGGYDRKNGERRFPSPAVIQEAISYSSNAGIALSDGLQRKYPNFLPLSDQISEIAGNYARKKSEGNAVDFDDLLSGLLDLLDRDTEIRSVLQDRFRHVLIDEYQDTNFMQSAIVSRLAGEGRPNIMAVGDDAQSIYSFRAADIRNILDFPSHFPGARIFKMTVNYRSTPQILDLANEVISHNSEQFHKELTAMRDGQVKPKVMPAVSAGQEAVFVAGRIEDLLERGANPAEIAVLFRATFHSQQLEFELMRRGIEYEYRGGLKFFDRAHVKDVLAFLRIRSNPRDEASWLRVLSLQEGVGDVTAGKITQFMKESGSLAMAVTADVGGMFGSRAGRGWSALRRSLEALHGAGDAPADQIRSILKSPYAEYLEAEYPNARDRLEDLEQMATFSERYAQAGDFLAEITLDDGVYGRPAGSGREGTVRSRSPKPVLSTVHQAKGLEWDTVFVIHLTANSFPNRNAAMEEGGLEEERRLFYVAVTRARHSLYLTHPSSVGRDFSYEGPSRFLEEIDPNCVDGGQGGSFGSPFGPMPKPKFIGHRPPVDDGSQPGYEGGDGEGGTIELDENGDPIRSAEMRETRERVRKTSFLGDY